MHNFLHKPAELLLIEEEYSFPVKKTGTVLMCRAIAKMLLGETGEHNHLHITDTLHNL